MAASASRRRSSSRSASSSSSRFLVYSPPSRCSGAGGWAGTTSSSRVVMYAIAGHGITIGYHRLFTHKSFKANRPLKIALAFAGGMAIEGPVVRWVADHRRHHAFSDKEGDPHSPWRFGTSLRRPDQGPALRARRLDLRPRADRRHPLRARPDRRHRHRRGVAAVLAAGHVVPRCCRR